MVICRAPELSAGASASAWPTRWLDSSSSAACGVTRHSSATAVTFTQTDANHGRLASRGNNNRMTMLAEQVDGVIGVDTHRDTLAAAAVTTVGAVLAHTDTATDARGYQELVNFARQHVPGARCWALEGTGSYGAGPAAFLDAAGEHVVEVCRPKRPVQRGGRKTDNLDAVRAAREALASEQLIHPRRRREREALRVLLTTRHSAVLAATAAINQSPDHLRTRQPARRAARQAQLRPDHLLRRAE